MLKKKIQICTCVHILCETWEMVISHHTFAENMKEMHRGDKFYPLLLEKENTLLIVQSNQSLKL